MQFQDDDTEGAADGLDEGNANGTLENTATGTLEERLTKLEERVTALENWRQDRYCDVEENGAA
ncbi:hypothetical protein D1872_344470 [compost metagenome]